MSDGGGSGRGPPRDGGGLSVLPRELPRESGREEPGRGGVRERCGRDDAGREVGVFGLPTTIGQSVAGAGAEASSTASAGARRIKVKVACCPSLLPSVNILTGFSRVTSLSLTAMTRSPRATLRIVRGASSVLMPVTTFSLSTVNPKPSG